MPRCLFHGAVEVYRPVVASLSQHGDQALRFPQSVGADEMRTIGEQRDRVQQFSDLGRYLAMAKYRQSEGGLGDENVAGERLEWGAGRIALVFVIAGGDDPHPVRF